MCEKHVNYINRMLEDFDIVLSTQGSSQYSDTCFEEAQEEEANREKCKSIAFHLRQIAQISQIQNVHMSESFLSLSPSTKRKRIYAAKNILSVICAAMAPDSPIPFEKDVLQLSQERQRLKDFSKFEEVLNAVTEAFLVADKPNEKKQILSIVSPFMTYSDMLKYLPNLSRFYYTESRMYAKKYGFGAKAPAIPNNRIKYDRAKVENFIQYITSPVMVADLPYGFKTIKCSAGIKEEIPNLVRFMVAERIVDSYLEYLEQQDHSDLAMSRSSLLRILSYCPASTRKSLQGIDYLLCLLWR